MERLLVEQPEYRVGAGLIQLEVLAELGGVARHQPRELVTGGVEHVARLARAELEEPCEEALGVRHVGRAHPA
jgi:hypothetical protein